MRGYKVPSDQADSFWERMDQLIQEARELDAGTRSVFLASACGGDHALRHAVEKLLDSSTEAEANPLWREPAIRNEARFQAASDDATSLDRCLLERIGAGGMGVVHRAIRADDEFSKLVAVKIVLGTRARARHPRLPAPGGGAAGNAGGCRARLLFGHPPAPSARAWPSRQAKCVLVADESPGVHRASSPTAPAIRTLAVAATDGGMLVPGTGRRASGPRIEPECGARDGPRRVGRMPVVHFGGG